MKFKDLDISKNKSSSDEKNQNNNHLGNKLNRHFSPLLFIGVFGGFIIYITFSILFIKKAQSNKTIKEALTNLNLQQTEQLIFEVEEILIYRTQSCFDLLRKIEANAIFFSELYDKGQVKSNIDEYISQNSINLNAINDEIENNEKMGIWGINEYSEKINALNDDIKKELFIFTSLNPLLNSNFSNINFKESYVENIYIINKKKELFYDFPLVKDTYFKKGNHKSFCFNEIKGVFENFDEIIMPDIYDFHCQEWFADSINLHKMINSNYYISPPYYIEKNEKILISTLCINSTKINNNNEIEIGDYYLFCLNIRYLAILENLSVLNHKISGYFFITRVFTQKAFYYPKRTIKSSQEETKSYYFDNFGNEEFELNDNYYLDELNKYLNTTISFINSYNNTQVNSLSDIQEQNLKGEFIKDNKKYWFYILPIFNHMQNISINLLNIIYICPNEVIENKLELISEQTINVSTLSFPFFLFLIQTLIVQILISYLIYAIAFNIVLPMKNIKKIFEKFNNDGGEGDVEEETDNLLLKNIKMSMNNGGVSNNIINSNENNENGLKEKNENKNDTYSKILLQNH